MTGSWQDAFSYPVRGERAERPFLATWVAFLVAVVVPVLPVIPVVGYLVRLLVARGRGEDAPAFLASARALLRRGVGGSLVAAVYLAVPLVALLVTVYGAMEAGAGTGDDPGAALLFYGGSTAVLCLALAGAYLCPVALYAYGDERALRAAFRPGTLRAVGGHAAYFTRWVAGATVLAVAVGIAGATASVPRAGPVVATAAVAYGVLVAFGIIGRGVWLAWLR